MQAKYVNPFTDYGFKKLFGEEASKPQLIDFLNALLQLPDKIVHLAFKNAEQLGMTELNRKAIYDIYCESESGDRFIVELQKAKQNYFVDRTIYYSTFPIQEQAKRGFRDFGLKAVYCIGILDFVFRDYIDKLEEKRVVHTVLLKDDDCKVFYDRLTYVYLEMPNFTKTETELTTRLDKWLYFLKNLEDFDSIPAIFRDVIFEQAFKTAEIPKMNYDERFRYEQSLKIDRDNKNTFDYAMQEALKKSDEKIVEITRQAEEASRQAEEAKEQIAEAKEQIAEAKEQTAEAIRKAAAERTQIIKTARQMGLSIEAISQLTGLTEAEISNTD